MRTCTLGINFSDLYMSNMNARALGAIKDFDHFTVKSQDLIQVVKVDSKHGIADSFFEQPLNTDLIGGIILLGSYSFLRIKTCHSLPAITTCFTNPTQPIRSRSSNPCCKPMTSM